MKTGALIYRLGAVSNFAVTLPAIIDPRWSASFIGLPGLSENGLFLLRIWAGMAFLWGLMFLEVASDLRRHKAMLKYTWLEKSITAASVTIAWSLGQIEAPVFYMILATDYVWIVPFFVLDATTRGNPDALSAVREAGGVLRLGQGAQT